MEIEIIKKDRVYRRKLFTWYLIGISSAIIIWRWGIPALVQFIQSLPIKERIETVELLSHLVLLFFFPPAVYLINIGHKVCKHNAIPYPGMRVIRDTVVIRGKKALIRGKSLIILGIVMIVVGITSMFTTHYIIARLKNHPRLKPIFYKVDDSDRLKARVRI